MKAPQYVYRINLAVADLLIGSFAFVPSIYFATVRFKKAAIKNKNIYLANQLDIILSEPNILEFVIGFVSWVSFLVSVFTLVAAGFDRVFSTVFPKRYVKRYNSYVTVGVCAVVWIAAVCNSTVFFNSTSSVITTPYFVSVVCNRAKKLHQLIGNTIVIVVMLTNTFIVMLVLDIHNRFVFCFNGFLKHKYLYFILFGNKKVTFITML